MFTRSLRRIAFAKIIRNSEFGSHAPNSRAQQSVEKAEDGREKKRGAAEALLPLGCNKLILSFFRRPQLSVEQRLVAGNHCVFYLGTPLSPLQNVRRNKSQSHLPVRVHRSLLIIPLFGSLSLLRLFLFLSTAAPVSEQ